MLFVRSKKLRLISGIMTFMMLFMSVWMTGVSPVSALTHAVVNATTGVGYGEDLQAAIDAAAEGQTIEVYSGSYESINIDKSISLIAPNGPSSVSIAISESEPAIVVGRFSFNLTIKGFSIISKLEEVTEFGSSSLNGAGIAVDDLLDVNTIVIEDCEFEAGLYAILFKDLLDASITIRNNSFRGGYDENLIHFEGDVRDSSVLISSNQFDGFGEAISGGGNQFWGYSGRTVFTVSDNTFDDGEIAIYIPWLLDGGSCDISDNTITNCDYPIEIWEIGYYERGDSDPFEDYRPCSVLINGNTIGASGNYGIHVEYLYNGSVSITDNTITDLAYHSVYMYNINPVRYGHDVSVEISGNKFSGNGSESIYIDHINTSEAASAQINIHHNDLIDNDIGLYFDEIDLYDDSSIAICSNTFHRNNYGIYFNNTTLGYETNARIDIEGNLFLDNETGLYFYDTTVNPNESMITITLNNFLSNDCGVFLRNRFYMINPDQLIIALNQFNGNHSFGVHLESPSYAEGIREAVATSNWWGSEAGPTPVSGEILLRLLSSELGLMNETETGDPISENMVFDPWLARLVVTPSGTSLPVGDTLTLSAQILDNEGKPVIANGLTVQFTITGAHSSNQTVPFSGTTAVQAYAGSVIGTDTIQAEVFFNGEPSGLKTGTQVAWFVAPTSLTEPTGPTGSGAATTPSASEELETDTQVIPKMGEESHSALIVTAIIGMFALVLILKRKRSLS